MERFQLVAMWETGLGHRTEFAHLLESPDEAQSAPGIFAAGHPDELRSIVQAAISFCHNLGLPKARAEIILPSVRGRVAVRVASHEIS